MKNFLISLWFCGLLVNSINAQPSDSLYRVQQNAITSLEKKVQNAEKYNAAVEVQLKVMKTQVAALAAKNEFLSEEIRQKQQAIDSLSKVVARNTLNIQATADSLGIRIQTTDEAVSDNSNSLKSKTKWGIIAFILALLASIVVWLLYKKGQRIADSKITSLIQQADESKEKITSLTQQADELNEKIVGQFSSEMNELQKIGESLKNAGGSTTAEPDHSLVKTLADRITFMEMTLYRMDSSVKGHKQLSKSITQMKDNLLANGYEIVDMLGKEYDEGMKVTANFIEDENIEEGKQIITGIVKPQINYKGVMIQSAQITVSQN